MMDKAQEAKRKWNLDDKTGKTSKISKPLLLFVAKDIGLEVMDGDPNLVECMIQLDCSRNADSKLICKHPSCNKVLSPEKEINLDKPSSSNENHSHSLVCQNRNSDKAEANSELGWSSRS